MIRHVDLVVIGKDNVYWFQLISYTNIIAQFSDNLKCYDSSTANQPDKNKKHRPQ